MEGPNYSDPRSGFPDCWPSPRSEPRARLICQTGSGARTMAQRTQCLGSLSRHFAHPDVYAWMLLLRYPFIMHTFDITVHEAQLIAREVWIVRLTAQQYPRHRNYRWWCQQRWWQRWRNRSLGSHTNTNTNSTYPWERYTSKLESSPNFFPQTAPRIALSHPTN